MPKCEMCGKEHNANDYTYLTVQGNVYVGDKGGIIGNNFPSDKEVFGINEVKRNTFCWPCFFELMFRERDALKSELTRQIVELENKRKSLSRNESESLIKRNYKVKESSRELLDI